MSIENWVYQNFKRKNEGVKPTYRNNLDDITPRDIDEKELITVDDKGTKKLVMKINNKLYYVTLTEV